MEIVIRASIVYFFLWVAARSVGKRELSELTAFELILLVIMGDLVQQGVTQEDMSITGAILAVGTLAFWIILFSYLSWRFNAARPLVEGVSVVVVQDGRPLHDMLRLERLTVAEVKEEARKQGIADLRSVQLGVLEPDGKLSFIRADGEQQEAEGKHTI